MEYILIEEKTADSAEYGIALLDGDRRVEVPGLTEERSAAEALTALLNELRVEPCHFEDVIEDYLTDFSV